MCEETSVLTRHGVWRSVLEDRKFCISRTVLGRPEEDVRDVGRTDICRACTPCSLGNLRLCVRRVHTLDTFFQDANGHWKSFWCSGGTLCRATISTHKGPDFGLYTTTALEDKGMLQKREQRVYVIAPKNQVVYHIAASLINIYIISQDLQICLLGKL